MLWFFVWTVRRAAAAAGHHRSLAEAKTFYRQLASEINEACDRGAVPAGPAHAVPVPLLHPSLRWELVRVWAHRIANMWTLKFLTVGEISPSELQPESPPGSELGARYRRVLCEPAELAAVSPALSERLAILRTIHGVFAAVLPWITLAGAIGVVLQLVLRRCRWIASLLPIQLAFLTAIGVRTGMVAVIATNCWPTSNIYALCCVYPLLPVVSLIDIDAGTRLLMVASRRERMTHA